MSLTDAKLSSLRDKHLEQEAEEAKKPKVVPAKSGKKLGSKKLGSKKLGSKKLGSKKK